MNDKLILHIVSFTIPYPADYGGVIDVFFKIKSLSEQGVKIILHCFQYDRYEAPELEKYCKKIYYYKRPIGINYFFSKKPFIVLTRNNKQLLKNLSQDNFPILFEGLHTTYFLKKLARNDRKVIVRTHNIEHEYYSLLAKSEKNIFKRVFFYAESKKLKKFEAILKLNISIAAISDLDYEYFKKLNTNTFLLKAFHPFDKLNISPGKGDYILFHGNLSIQENNQAAQYIIHHICKHVNFNYKIAGKNPSKELYTIASKHTNIEIIANPSIHEMQDLIKNAHIHLLLTDQPTGLKLKLVNALYNGRYCIANNNMMAGSGLEDLCHIKDTAQEIIDEIKVLKEKPFTNDEINKRREILLKNVNNKLGAQKLINLLDKS